MLGRAVWTVRRTEPHNRQEWLRTRCLLAHEECNEEDPCPLHDRWKLASLEMENLLREATLADLLRLRPSGKPQT